MTLLTAADVRGIIKKAREAELEAQREETINSKEFTCLYAAVLHMVESNQSVVETHAPASDIGATSRAINQLRYMGYGVDMLTNSSHFHQMAISEVHVRITVPAE